MKLPQAIQDLKVALDEDRAQQALARVELQNEVAALRATIQTINDALRAGEVVPVFAEGVDAVHELRKWAVSR